MSFPAILTTTPNTPQRIPLRLAHPSQDNCRLFIERESLDGLRLRYRAFMQGVETVLPDPPILRVIRAASAHKCKQCHGVGFDICHNNREPVRFEILAGERRITAATLEGVEVLLCRVVEMSDEEAYKFILEHNNVAGLTTVELAFRAAEMERLGFTDEDISAALGGVSVGRYLTVGQLVNPDWFSDDVKKCDPSIVEWFECAQFGNQHFAMCFHHWNNGAWGEKECARNFRKRGEALPIDNAEKGFRVTLDLNRLVVRGQLDIDIIEDGITAERMMSQLCEEIRYAQRMFAENKHFGPREVVHINPTTV